MITHYAFDQFFGPTQYLVEGFFPFIIFVLNIWLENGYICLFENK